VSSIDDSSGLLALGMKTVILTPLRALARKCRQVAQRRQRARLKQQPPIEPSAFAAILQRLGLRRGMTVFVHSAWENMIPIRSGPLEVIHLLQDAVGENGTLLMPCYSYVRGTDGVFDLRWAPTSAGLLAEAFRRSKGVRRSANNHSVSALGRQATELVQDHHHSLTSWDGHSPFMKMRELESLVICLGLPHSFGLGTHLHCADSMLYYEFEYFRRLFGPVVEIPCRLEDGTRLVLRHRHRLPRFFPNRTRGYFDPRRIVVFNESGIRFQSVAAPYLIDRIIELGRHGYVNYHLPFPARRLWRKPVDMPAAALATL